MDLIDHTSTQFSLPELVLVAEQVGLAPTSRWGARRLIDAINAKIDRDGIPEPPDLPSNDINDLERKLVLVEEYLYIAGFVDGQGNPIERKPKKLPLDEFMQLHVIPKTPDCYSFADDRDPACQRCMLYIYCAEKRLECLPPCFALLWDKNAAECSVCIDAPFCKDATLSKRNNNNQ
jgi:hypothetical protein